MYPKSAYPPSLGGFPIVIHRDWAYYIADIYFPDVKRMAGKDRGSTLARPAISLLLWSHCIVSIPRPPKPTLFALNRIRHTHVRLSWRLGIGALLTLSTVLVLHILLLI